MQSLFSEKWKCLYMAALLCTVLLDQCYLLLFWHMKHVRLPLRDSVWCNEKGTVSSWKWYLPTELQFPPIWSQCQLISIFQNVLSLCSNPIVLNLSNLPFLKEEKGTGRVYSLCQMFSSVAGDIRWNTRCAGTSPISCHIAVCISVEC